MIAIPVRVNKEDLMNSQVSKFFSKTEDFLLVSENGAEVVENTFESGKLLARRLVEKGVKTVIINHLGEKPYGILLNAQVNIKRHNFHGSADEILQKLKNNELEDFTADMVTPPKKKYCK